MKKYEFISGLLLLILTAVSCSPNNSGTEVTVSEEIPQEEWDIQQPEMIQANENIPEENIIWLSGSEEKLTGEQRALIEDYRRRYYDTLKDLEPREMADLFSSDASDWVALHENTWEYLTELRKMQQTDLRLSDYRSEMTVEQVEEEADGLRVIITEKSTQNFAQHPEIDSELYGIIHTYKLVPENGRWKIREHQQRDGIYWNMQREYWGAAIEQLQDPESYFAERKDVLLQIAGEELEKRIEQSVHVAGRTTSIAADAAYDSSAAIAYGSQWVGSRNPDWSDYTGRGGNCQNFVSQCLYAGGIPMDTEGGEVWKWYGEDINDLPEKAGSSTSWINVDGFYQYAKGNRGFGLVAETDGYFYDGRQGDTIIMGTREDWNHMVLISEVVSDTKGRTLDYLILSNTSDVKNFPASAYPSPCQSVIRIIGWNR